MELKDIVKGQTVLHILGYTGQVVNVTVNGNVHVRSLEAGKFGSQVLTVGSSCICDPKHLTPILKKENKVMKDLNELQEVNKAIEGLTNLMAVAKEMDKEVAAKEATTFKCTLGEGITFEGTHEDFAIFLAGMSALMTADKSLAQKKMK